MEGRPILKIVAFRQLKEELVDQKRNMGLERCCVAQVESRQIL
jgi:hypothetical protein